MSSVTDQALLDEFELFGVDLDDDFFPKLRDQCIQFHLKEAEIVKEWMAFKCSKNLNSMSLATLERFEREWLPKKGTKVLKKEEQNVTKSSFGNRIGDEDVDIISMYANTTPTSTGKTPGKRQVTPDERDALRKRLADSERSPVVQPRVNTALFSPVSVNGSVRFTERISAGEVVASFGAADGVVWKGSSLHCAIKYYGHTTDKPYKYMFQKLSVKAESLNDQLEDMQKLLQQHYGFEDVAHVAQSVQEAVQVVGRIACDSQGKLNSHSIILQGSKSSSSGRTCPVSFHPDIKEFALFPGKIVAADAENTTGQKLFVTKLYPSVKLPFPQLVTKTEPGTRLQVMIASGPFSTSNDLLYDPLRALLEQMRKEHPDVCILIGPFVDIKNSIIESGKMNECYEDTFKKFLEMIAEETEKLDCQIIVVPSSRDAHHHPVYPQMPFLYSHHYSHVHLVWDPSTLIISNIVFGITSTDILFHLSSEEIAQCAPGTTDRLGRLTQHLLDQHSYYPLYPPSEDVNADLEHFEDHVKMSATPHVLVCASDLRFFIKDCSGCLCINPGRLTKGQVGGTYARLLLQSPKSIHPSSIVATAVGQILRI